MVYSKTMFRIRNILIMDKKMWPMFMTYEEIEKIKEYSVEVELVNNYIRELFSNPLDSLKIVAHTNHPDDNKIIFEKVVLRLKTEYPDLKFIANDNTIELLFSYKLILNKWSDRISELNLISEKAIGNSYLALINNKEIETVIEWFQQFNHNDDKSYLIGGNNIFVIESDLDMMIDITNKIK